jgi:hypothetical protein
MDQSTASQPADKRCFASGHDFNSCHARSRWVSQVADKRCCASGHDFNSCHERSRWVSQVADKRCCASGHDFNSCHERSRWVSQVADKSYCASGHDFKACPERSRRVPIKAPKRVGALAPEGGFSSLEWPSSPAPAFGTWKSANLDNAGPESAPLHSPPKKPQSP